MLVDSEPEEECSQSLNWVMAGKAKQNGGSEMGNPHVGVKDEVVCLSDVECSYQPKAVPTPVVEEWHHTLQRTKPESTANAQEHALLKEGGNT